jgi:hypothetical protein
VWTEDPNSLRPCFTSQNGRSSTDCRVKLSYRHPKMATTVHTRATACTFAEVSQVANWGQYCILSEKPNGNNRVIVWKNDRLMTSWMNEWTSDTNTIHNLMNFNLTNLDAQIFCPMRGWLIMFMPCFFFAKCRMCTKVEQSSTGNLPIVAQGWQR